MTPTESWTDFASPSAPGARPHHLGAELLVAMVDGRALRGLVRPAREEAERDGRPRRAGSGRSDRRLVLLVLARVEADRGHVAQAALAGAHRHRGVALGELDGVEALADRPLQVLVRHVLADADKALALARGAVVGRSRYGAVEALAGDRPDGLDPVRDVGRDEHPALRVVLDPRAHLGEEGVGRLAAPGHDEEIAGELASVNLDRPQHASAAAGDDLADALAPQVVDAVDPHACLLQGGGGLAPRFVHGHDNGLLGGLDAPVFDQPAHAVGEHHPHEVVAREDERLLDRPSRDDDLLGAEPVEDVARVDGDEPAFPDPERAPGRDDVYALQRIDEALVHEDDLPSCGSVLPGSLAPRPAAADDQDFGAAVLDVVAVCAAGVLVQLAQSGDVAKELLVQRPGPARPDHRPVVEADRRERTAELVGGDERVVLQ
jgi:hypothetical protein